MRKLFKTLTFLRVPSNKEIVDGKVPSNKDLVDRTGPSNKELVDGTVPSNSTILLFICKNTSCTLYSMGILSCLSDLSH